MFAEIIIPLALPKNYTWSIPSALQDKVKQGIRVEVVLGKKRKYAGIIKNIFSEKPKDFDPKPILNILDNAPILFPQQLKLWEWISDYYLCSEGEVMQAAIPSHLKLSSETILIFNEDAEDFFSELDDQEFLVAEALLIKKELNINEVQKILDITHVYPVVNRLIEKKVCFVWETLIQKFKEKKENFITLHSNYNSEEALEELLNNWSRAPKQMELLLAFLHLQKTENEVSQSALLKKSGASSAQLNALIEKNILISNKKSIFRNTLPDKKINVDFELSKVQSNALLEITNCFSEKNTCLLHGVTSSGKTQVYVKLIETFLEKNEQVLYMLPEIALTSQIIRRLQQYFGGNIAIYHSKFNPNERVEIWNRVKSGEIKIVLGARSSMFLPFKNLGLIIVDEEHDTSYKQQDPAPRYHARDSAIYYASLFKAKVLLGSATPSLETYFNCQQNKYGLVNIHERFGDMLMPNISIINTSIISQKTHQKVLLTPQLEQQIEETLQNKKQVILFQNRRGYTPYMVCNTCGWIPKCHQCDVTLTYHKSKNVLTCHYCANTYPLQIICGACGSHFFKQKSFGTEKIEEEITEKFSNAKISRMDYDSVKGKHDHDTLIKQFEQHKIDILIGTQMVVKGLDFENVNLVGILDADGILNFSDFRVNERAYQLMEQVSGRAGRKDKQGNVLIQVSNTKHPVLQFVKEHNYIQLFEFEIENRKQFFYPPYSRLVKILFKHKYKNKAEEAAHIMQLALSKYIEKEFINGPAEPVINRIRNQYIFEIIIRLKRNKDIIDMFKKIFKQQVIIIQNNKLYRSVQIIADVDPY